MYTMTEAKELANGMWEVEIMKPEGTTVIVLKYRTKKKVIETAKAKIKEMNGEA